MVAVAVSAGELGGEKVDARLPVLLGRPVSRRNQPDDDRTVDHEWPGPDRLDPASLRWLSSGVPTGWAIRVANSFPN